MTNSYSEGRVTGTIYVGGLVGYAGGAITSSYHIGGDVSGKLYVGGLAGDAFGAITSSYSKSLVTASGSYVGGLAGRTSKAVTGSYSVGNITGKGYVGGAVGYAYNVADISKTHADGLVKGDSSFVGGVVGYASGAIDSAYHIGGDVSGTEYVGGLTGQTISSVINSYSEGNVTGTSRYVGGLIGYGKSIDSSYHTNGEVSGLSYVGGLIGMASSTVKNSYSEGDVTGTGDYVGGLIGNGVSVDSSNHAKGNVGGANYIGGLIGNASSTVKNSYSEGDVAGTSDYVGGLVGNGVSVDSSNHAKGNVSGTNYIGGLIGYASSGVKNSYSEGDVTGTGNYVGGLIGMSYYRSSGSYDITITTIQNSHATGNVEGKRYVGGLIGLDSIYMSSNYGQTLVKEIFNAYSVGNVLGTGNYVGGVIGKSDYGHNSSSNIKISLPIFASYHKGSVEGASSYVGGVAGYARGSVSSSHHTDGDVSGAGYVGGLIGQASSAVTNSYSEGNVTGTSSYVGGLVGYGSSVASSRHTKGDVNGTNSVGGLIGLASSVTNSYSEGNVTGSSSYVGGIAGSSGKIRNSYAEAKYVRGQNIVGGLAGYVTDSIDVSYFEGDSVRGINKIGGLVGYANKTVDSSYSTAHVKGDDEVGGLVGSAYGDVSNSYAIGNVVGDVEHSSAGNDNLGGLVGYQYSGSVSKSMALGNVSGTTKLGGLIGRFDGEKISQSYANGNVTGDYYGDPADEVGNYYIGGLVGYAKGTLEEIYASGAVKGIEDEPVYTGCVVGYVNGSLSVSKSYYDKTKCGLGIDGGEETATVSGSPAKTTSEMQTQETFENWDFAETWKIKENAYPFLQIYNNSLANAVVTTASLEGIVYDGTAKTPLVTSVSLFGETLEYETEYTITYKDNINAGTASINVCGVKPYGGCKVVKFDIAGIAVKPTIAAIDYMTYTGLALIPEIEVYNGETLLASTDYSVEYKDNVNAGTATVTVTMKGNYSGSASKTFTIEKATPVISQNPVASDVVLGQALAASELSGGHANVDGEFVWKTPTAKPELENEGYAVVFVATDTNYTKSAEIIVPVKVLDMVFVAVHAGDITLDSAMLIRGSSYTLPNISDSTGYDFVGLYNGKTVVGKPGDQISISENTVIEAVYKVKTFEITFKNGTTVLQSGEIAYGVLPEYAGAVPTKTANAQYTYTFIGWKPAIVEVTGSAMYEAMFDSTVNKYEIAFVKGSSVLQSTEIAYGMMPTAPAVTLPENTAQYTYSFNGWDKEIVPVTESVTYAAVIDSVVNKYEITFEDYDGTILKKASLYDYGTTVSDIVKPSSPIRDNTAQYSYAFKTWSPAITDVTEDVVYTAVYDSTIRSYTISFVNGGEVLQSGAFDYGETPTYEGNEPTKAATDQCTNTFLGWSPSITTVSRNATYMALFDCATNSYTITFMKGSVVLQSTDVPYGTMPTAPEVTVPANTAQYTYSFNGWNQEIVPVTGNAVYAAVVDSVVNKYEISFKDYDGTVLMDASLYNYGTDASDIAKPSSPTRGNTAQYSYAFKTWSPAIADVTEDAVYTAKYDSTIRSYTISFVNGDKVLQSGAFDYGETPTYEGDEPTKAATDQCTNSFIGWSPSITTVSRDATYRAVFDCATNSYTITFKKGSVVLQSTELAYGTMPTAPTVTLPKNTAQYTYSFRGWDKEIVPATESVTYTAVIDSVVNKYEISFVDYDGSVLKNATLYDYGTAVSDIAKPSNPARNNTAQYSYAFKIWSPTITDVTENVVYIAEYDSTIRSYTITFKKGASVLQSTNVAYGTTPTAPTVTLPKNTAQYTYSFGGWDKEISPVTGNATYTAIIDSVVNKYNIVFKNYDGTLIKDSAYVYGSTVVKPIDPIRLATSKYSYTFKGWTPTVASVTADAVYKAVFDSAVISYTITFVNGSDTLRSSRLNYGTMPSYNGVVPTKDATAQYAYTFKGWNPSIAYVSKNATYKAVFDSTVQKYTVAFMNGSKLLQRNIIAYGSLPKYTSATPTKTSTKNYSYEFAGWSPRIETVTGEATYQAVFDSTKLTGIMDNRFADLEMSVSVISRNIQISAAPVGSTYAILDMQGRVLKNGRVESVNFNIAIQQAGNYLVRIGGKTQVVNVK